MNHMTGRVGRLTGLAAVTAAAALVLTGCTTAADTAQQDAIDDSDLGFLTQEQFDEISAKLEAAAAIPDTPVPTESIDVSQLEGKKALVMPSASFLTDCDIISKEMVATMEELGMEAAYFETDGTTESHVLGLQQATSQGYDLVVQLCGIDPDLMSTQITEAENAGVTVMSGALYDSTYEGGVSDLVSAQTNSPYGDAFATTALQAVMDNRAEPFGVLMLTADEVASTASMKQAATEVYETYCPECEITVVNVPNADAATDMTPAVQSALTADPAIKVVMPFYGGVVTTNAAAGVMQVNNPAVGIYGSYGMPIADIENMDEPTNLLMATTRHNNALRMVTTLDQALRALTGMELNDPNVYIDENRLVTPANAEAFLSEPNEGFGNEAVDAYRALWGLS